MTQDTKGSLSSFTIQLLKIAHNAIIWKGSDKWLDKGKNSGEELFQLRSDKAPMFRDR